MKAYTYQIGEGADDTMSKSLYSEAVYADSLGEAIDKAKAITNLRPLHENEKMVRIVEDTADEYPLWTSSAQDIRNG